MKAKVKKVIGWREYIDLPEWGIKKLKAKIDTGAKSCSLHVENVKELADEKISFYVVLGDNKKKKIIATPIRMGKVKSSVGTRTHRWFVLTQMKIGGIQRSVKINLTDRGEMNFRMLVGRTAIDDDFLVDVSQGYLLNTRSLSKKADKKSVTKTKSKKG